jgi:hypothetical protein
MIDDLLKQQEDSMDDFDASMLSLGRYISNMSEESRVSTFNNDDEIRKIREKAEQEKEQSLKKF